MVSVKCTCATIGSTSAKSLAVSTPGRYTWLNSKRRVGRRVSALSCSSTVMSSSAVTE